MHQYLLQADPASFHRNHVVPFLPSRGLRSNWRWLERWQGMPETGPETRAVAFCDYTSKDGAYSAKQEAQGIFVGLRLP
jgi:hypothetical protein